MIKANDIEMVKLGGMTLEERERYEKNKIEINKKVSSLIAEATKNAKLECCILCSKPCSSFCNSHSIPQFALKRIAEDGKVMLPLQDEILTIGKDNTIRFCLLIAMTELLVVDFLLFIYLENDSPCLKFFELMSTVFIIPILLSWLMELKSNAKKENKSNQE